MQDELGVAKRDFRRAKHQAEAVWKEVYVKAKAAEAAATATRQRNARLLAEGESAEYVAALPPVPPDPKAVPMLVAPRVALAHDGGGGGAAEGGARRPLAPANR